ncbi:TetR/AcrR family transcriptional regulator [Ornithinimicrobium sp. LYQ121]|uniref:TetR/AcrR family transcriptional regulator n=1 Tax=Ornithinimicrobium sp. LYQ121 TaxID=3378801 RepID=UPI0038541FD4
MSPAPVAAARPSAARERILDQAIALFYARGIRGVGVNLIIAESGVAKATFYKHFPSKDDLVVAYLDKVDDVWTGQLREAAEAAGPDPADQLVGMFDALSNACRREGFRGCAFINTAAESQPTTPVHARTVAHKTAVLAWVRGLAEQAGARNPGALARSLTMLLDGGLASGALDADPEAPAVAKATARAVVEAART